MTNLEFNKDDSDIVFGRYLKFAICFLMVLVSVILVFLIYSNTLKGPFIFDDVVNISENRHIQVPEITLSRLRDAAFESRCSNRPVANISFALNYYFHQNEVFGYHAVNIFIHVMNGFLLYFLLKMTMVISRRGSPGLVIPGGVNVSWVAFFAMLVWLVHPLHTQSVSYLVQRMTSMAAMFYLLSMVLYVRGRLSAGVGWKWVLYGMSIGSGVLAIGTKEISATLPFFIFLYEWYFFQDLDRVWLRRNLVRVLVIAVILLIVGLLYLGVHPFDRILAGYKMRDFTPGQRVLTEFRVVVHYLSLLVLPHPSRLNLDYDFPMSYSLINPITTLLSIGSIVGLVVLAVYMARRDRIISFAILWFLGNLVIESSVMALEIVYEHRTYLPSMFVIPLVVLAVLRYLKPRWIGVVCICVLVAGCSFWTYERNKVWSDDETLWRDCVEKSPNKARPHNNYGLALAHKGRYSEAIKQYYRALEIKNNPVIVEVHSNLGLALIHEERIDEAIYHFSQALALNPYFEDMHYNLGQASALKGLLDEAIKHFANALKINSESSKIHFGLAAVYEEQGNYRDAEYHYRQAMRIDRDNPLLHLRYGNFLAKVGNIDGTIRQYLDVLKLDPDNLEAHRNLGIGYFENGNIDDAVYHLKEALRLDPSYAKTHCNLGIALSVQGEKIQAIQEFQETIRLDPDYEDAYYNLGVILLNGGRLSEAIENFNETLKINHEHKDAKQCLMTAMNKKGQIDAAIEKLKEAMEASPDDAELYAALGDLYRNKGEFSKAIDYYNTALTINLGSIKILYSLVVVNSIIGDYDTTLVYLRKIMELQPEDPNAYYNIACVYAKQQHVDQSIMWLKKAVEKGFDDWNLLKEDNDLYHIRCTSYFQDLIRDR